MLEMLPGRVDMVGGEGAAGADVIRARRQHEVVDGELAPVAEQVGERAVALGTLEDIGLVDPDPGQLPALGAQRVELVGHGAFFGEKRLAGVEPFFARNDRVVHGRSPSGIGSGVTERRASRSQGGKWNRLISRYIAVMPSIGRTPAPCAQSPVIGMSVAVTSPISAKVGAAASASQPAGSPARAVGEIVGSDALSSSVPAVPGLQRKLGRGGAGRE